MKQNNKKKKSLKIFIFFFKIKQKILYCVESQIIVEYIYFT